MEMFCSSDSRAWQMFQDAAWCRVQSSDPGNCSQVIPAKKPGRHTSSQGGTQAARALKADKLSDFFREFRKHQ